LDADYRRSYRLDLKGGLLLCTWPGGQQLSLPFIYSNEVWGKDVWFHYGQMQSQMAARTNDDGSLSFITITPTLQGLEFVVARDGQGRTLITRDAQHEYLFKEE
jgi:hypothetical protein